MWTPLDWLNKFYSFYMAAVVSIVSRCAPSKDTRNRNQPNKNKLTLTLTVILYYRYVIKIVHEDYTMLMPKCLGGASLQLLAVYLPLTFVGVIIPAKYKITESMT